MTSSDDPPARAIYTSELRRGDVVMMPFEWGYSTYVIFSIKYWEENDTVDIRYLGMGGPPGDSWLEAGTSTEPAGDEFCRRGHLIRDGAVVEADPTHRSWEDFGSEEDSDPRRGR